MTFAHMTAVADRIDRITSALGRAVAWMALVVVLLQFALVIVRYLFGLGSVWLTETVVYAHATVFMLAAAWTLQVGGHVRVDIFYADASARTKALIDLVAELPLGRFHRAREMSVGIAPVAHVRERRRQLSVRSAKLGE